MATEQQVPNIVKAAYEMAALNNSPSTKPEVLEEVLDLTGTFDLTDMIALDNWLKTLSEDELSNVLDGEETEMDELINKSPSPSVTRELLDTIFNEVI